MKLSRNWLWFLCVLILASVPNAWSQDAADSEAVRPSGVSGTVRKAKAVTAKDKLAKANRSDDEQDADAEPTPTRKAKTSKSTHARSHRARAKSKETPETIAAPTEYTPEGIPKTSAASVIVVDANSGKTLYEKNPDQFRAPASTQKLLTALIVAESGFLDRQVTVQPTDTMAEPVKLNIKAGDTYQRIDLLRALLVKSPNDVARCLARDNAGSIEAFAGGHEQTCPTTWSCAFALCESKWSASAGTVLHRARPLAHRARCLCESDNPIDRLSSAACFSLRQRSHTRA